MLRRLSAFEQTLCTQSLRGVATLGQMVTEVQTWRAVSPCGRSSHFLDAAVTISAIACSQATATSTEHEKEAWDVLRASPKVAPELAEVSRRPPRSHPHRLS